MTRTMTNSLAAIAAVFLAITSIGTIAHVPAASAQTTNAAVIELA